MEKPVIKYKPVIVLPGRPFDDMPGALKIEKIIPDVGTTGIMSTDIKALQVEYDLPDGVTEADIKRIWIEK